MRCRHFFIDTITFSLPPASTITLLTALPDITHNNSSDIPDGSE
jgi:hypothetical protein